MRAALMRCADPMAQGEDCPLGRLLDYLPSIYAKILVVGPHHLLDVESFAMGIEAAQRCWAILHPDGVRRYPDDHPSAIAGRWLHPGPSFGEDTCEVLPDPDPGWNEIPPLSPTQRTAERDLLLALIPFAVQRTAIHSRARLPLTTAVLWGLQAVLAATVVPRSGRVPMLDYAVLQRVDRATSRAQYNDGSVWWVPKVPQAVEVRLQDLVRHVKLKERMRPRWSDLGRW